MQVKEYNNNSLCILFLSMKNNVLICSSYVLSNSLKLYAINETYKLEKEFDFYKFKKCHR